MSALTRGPLPARVYWTRRILLLVVVVALVLGIAKLLQLGGDGSSNPDPQARLAADSSPTASESTEVAEAPTAGVTQPAGREARLRDKQREKRDESPSPTLAAPEGTCAGSDVAVTPVVKHPVAGSPVTVTLELRTISSEACTWRVSPSSVSVKITSGKDDIWSSQECRRGVPHQDVVLRNDHTTRVDVTWSARRSDEECSRYTEWALPGWYHVNAAALAGEPSDLQFELVAPKAPVVTKTVEPKPDQDRNRGGDGGDGGDGEPKHR